VEVGEASECFTSVKSTIPTKILFISLLLRLLFEPLFSHTACSPPTIIIYCFSSAKCRYSLLANKPRYVGLEVEKRSLCIADTGFDDFGDT